MGLGNSFAGLLLAAPLAWAHPGHHEPVYQHRNMPREARSLQQCDKTFATREFHERTVENFGEELLRLRRSLGIEPHDSPALHKRDYISVSRIDHRKNITVTLQMPPASLFSNYGACMLMPAVDQGPLYVKGEEVRKDITNGEKGIKMTLAIQLVDYKTCAVVPNQYIDIWSSNATGIYVGVQGYPGMGDPKDSSILKGTTLRGVQPTDANGIATFDTLFPGHYSGRATHIHAIAWLGAKKEANNTLTGGKAAHVGQIYFDQGLITNVDKATPYSSNKMVIQPNVRDFLFMAGANGDDPIVRYALVGNKIEDGIFAWIRFGINQNNNLKVDPAAFWTANGGVMNPTGPISKLGPGGTPGWGKNRKARDVEVEAEEEQ